MKNHGKFIYGLIGLCLLAFVGMAWAVVDPQEFFNQANIVIPDSASYLRYFGGASDDVTGTTNVSLTAAPEAKFDHISVYGGGKGIGVRNSSSLTVDLSGASADSALSDWTDYVLAGGSAITVGSNVTEGNVTLNIKDLGGVYSGYVAAGAHCLGSGSYKNTGTIQIILDDKSYANVEAWNGKLRLMITAFHNNYTKTVAELNNIELQIKQGSFRQITTIYQTTNSWPENAEVMKVNGDINVTISGGTTMNSSGAPDIFVGPYVDGAGWTVEGDSKIVFSGGNYKNSVSFGSGNGVPVGQKMIHNGALDMVISGDAGAKAVKAVAGVNNSPIFTLGSVFQQSGDVDKYKFNGSHAAITLSSLDSSNIDQNCKFYGSGRTNYAPYNTPVNKIEGAKLVFDNVSGAFGGTIVSMDVLEVRPRTAVTLLNAITDVKTISITGDWKNLGTSRTVMTLNMPAPESVALSAADAIGVASVKFNAARTEVIVTPKNSPVSVSPASLKLNVGESEVLTAKTAVSGETVAWKSGKPEVATVDTNGRVTAVGAGIAVISALGNLSSTTAGCTVTVVNTANPDPVPTPASVTTETVTSADNPVAKEKVPDIVKVVTPEAVAATDENKTDIAAKAGVDSADLSETSDGQLVIAPAIAKQAVEAVMAGDAAVQPKQIVSLPIVTADVDKNKVAALAFKVNGAELGATANSVVSDIALIKVLRSGGGAKFTYVSDPAAYATKCFTLKGTDGKSLAMTDKVDPTAVYTLVVFIQDNDADGFDYDKTEGSVIDPLAIATNAAAEPAPASGGSSGGGCSAGFPLLALLLIAPLAYRRKR